MSKFKEGELVVSCARLNECHLIRLIVSVNTSRNIYTVRKADGFRTWDVPMEEYELMYRKLTKLERALA